MTDKAEAGLLNFYEKYLLPYKDKEVNFLELGVFKGESLDYFNSFFTHPKTKIVGYDFRFLHENPFERVSLVKGHQENVLELQELGNTKGPFDIILDDCSHYGEFTQRSFDFLFSHLKSGGVYIITIIALNL